MELKQETIDVFVNLSQDFVKAFGEFQYATIHAAESLGVLFDNIPDWQMKLWIKKERGKERYLRAYKRKGERKKRWHNL